MKRVEFKQPFICFVFDGLTALSLVASGFVFAAMVMSQEPSTAGFAIICGGFLSAFLLMGFADLLRHAAKTSFNTGELLKHAREREPLPEGFWPERAAQKDLRISRNGEDLGELTAMTVRSMLRTGKLAPSDYYYDEGAGDWMELSSCEAI
jgi:hypothetical protein